MDKEEMLSSVESYNYKYAREMYKIIEAMTLIDRKFFVKNIDEAYLNTALSIGEGQTISQPSTVARMLVMAELKKGERVLEVGAGSGWNACLIAYLVYPGKVESIDRISVLVDRAEMNMKDLKESNKDLKLKIDFKARDAFSLKKGKYDKIIITAGILSKEQEKRVEIMAKDLLNENGRLLCPYTEGPLLVYDKKKGKLEKSKSKEQYVFVPLLEGEK
ncbi:MAG: methyltransferase domain-containing protein [archaeon]